MVIDCELEERLFNQFVKMINDVFFIMNANKLVADVLQRHNEQADKNTVQYIKVVAKKSNNIQQLEHHLSQIEINPKLAEELFTSLNQFNQIRENTQPDSIKRPKQYQLVQFEKPVAKKICIDQEVLPLKQQKKIKDLVLSQDMKERNQFARRLMEKQRNKKGKKLISHGIVLTQQEKQRLLPQMKQQSRAKFLQKRQQQQIQLFRMKIQDQKKIFKNQKLTLQQQKILKLNEQLLRIVEQQRTRSTNISVYKPPDQFQNQQQKEKKNKKHKLTNAKYVEQKRGPDSKLWQQSQINRTKAQFRTKDKIQDQATKKYQLLKQNQIHFVKLDILRQLKLKKQLLKKLQQEQQDHEYLSPIQKVKRSLPIYHFKQELLQLISTNQIIIMVGQTGSGKTTQLPQFLHQIGYTRLGKIGCTQPRRVAAMSVAIRVSEQMGCRLGQQVGYSIRFQDHTSQRTIIKYMTDGMLLKELMVQPDLKSYSVIMIDEAHERSLHTDLLLSIMKDLAKQRPELKIIISSATLEAEKFSQFYYNAPIIKIPGRRYPVDIFYTSNPEADYVEASVVTILQLHVTHQQGDILCFLTGQEQIQNTMEMLTYRTRGLGKQIKQMIILPIYSSLPADIQIKIFEPTPKNARKVILATNIAQTSLTIDNIYFVIDCGFCKQTAYNAKTGIQSLVVTPISKASANQRAGRAGRVAPGKCFRLYTLWSFQQQLEDSTIPQIQRTNLSNVVLTLKSMGINNLVNFDFLDPPPHQMLIKALEQLYALGSLNDRGDLTKLGKKMAQLPIDPMLAKMIIHSQHFQCVQQIITISAMLSVGNAVFYRPKEKTLHADNAHKNFFRPGGDHLALLNVYEQWKDADYSSMWCQQNYIQSKSMKRARDIKQQLMNLCERIEIDIEDPSMSVISDQNYTNVRKCIASGYFVNASRYMHGGTYKTIKYGNNIMIHPSSLLHKDHPEFVIYHQLVLTTKQYMRNVCEVQGEWLLQVAPQYYREEQLMIVKRKR